MDELRIEQRGPARWLILNRPDKRNALSRDLVRALHGAVTTAASRPRPGRVGRGAPPAPGRLRRGRAGRPLAVAP